MVMIPSDWFNKDHELFRIAWYLYDNQEDIDQDFMSGLISLLRDVEDDNMMEVGGFVKTGNQIEARSEEQVEIEKEAMARAVKAAQAKELERRQAVAKKKKKEAEDNPLLAMIDGNDVEDDVEEKPLSESIYDYYNADKVPSVIDQFVRIIKNERAKEKPKKKYKGKGYKVEEKDPRPKKEPINRKGYTAKEIEAGQKKEQKKVTKKPKKSDKPKKNKA